MDVPGRAPSGVQASSLTDVRLAFVHPCHVGFAPAEVAVLEVQRMWPSGVEVDWDALCARVDLADVKANIYARHVLGGPSTRPQ